MNENTFAPTGNKEFDTLCRSFPLLVFGNQDESFLDDLQDAAKLGQGIDYSIETNLNHASAKLKEKKAGLLLFFLYEESDTLHFLKCIRELDFYLKNSRIKLVGVCSKELEPKLKLIRWGISVDLIPIGQTRLKSLVTLNKNLKESYQALIKTIAATLVIKEREKFLQSANKNGDTPFFLNFSESQGAALSNLSQAERTDPKLEALAQMNPKLVLNLPESDLPRSAFWQVVAKLPDGPHLYACEANLGQSLPLWGFASTTLPKFNEVTSTWDFKGNAPVEFNKTDDMPLVLERFHELLGLARAYNDVPLYVIEPFGFVRKKITSICKAAGFTQVLGFDSIRSCWEVLGSHQGKGLVFCNVDFELKGESGLDLLNRIKSTATLSGIKVGMMVLERENSAVFEECIKMGTDFMLIKPFGENTLRTETLRLMEQNTHSNT